MRGNFFRALYIRKPSVLFVSIYLELRNIAYYLHSETIIFKLIIEMKHFNFSLFDQSVTWISYFFIVIASASNEFVQRGMFFGKEITVLAYQVCLYEKVYCISSFLKCINIDILFSKKFPPFFSYKKMKNGNYTFEGVFKSTLDDFQEYFKMGYVEY